MSDPNMRAFLPNKAGRILLESFDEIIGTQGFVQVLELASLPNLAADSLPDNLDRQFHFEWVSRLQSSLETLYGARGGLGLGIRAGRVCFKRTLRQFGAAIGVTETPFLLLPLPLKFKTGAESLARAFNQFTDMHVRVTDEFERLFWIVECCPVCWGRKSETPLCHLETGFLQEALSWVSGGKQFTIEETTCIAMGDTTCTFMIQKDAIE